MHELSPSQVRTVLAALIPKRRPALVTGPPGVGKSAIMEQLASELKLDLIISHPALGDPTDYKGMPWMHTESGRFVFFPIGDLERMVHAKRPTLVFLDDVGQASPAVQAPLMQLLHARRVGEHVVSPHVTFVAATNRREHRAGVSGLLEPVKSRFVTMLHMRADLDDWKAYAYEHKLHEAVIGFVTQFPDKLCVLNATTDMTNSPCPRTWEHASELLKLGLGTTEESAALAGAVGDGAAGELQAFVTHWRELQDIEALLQKPEKAQIPTRVDILFATCVSIVARASDKTLENALIYAERLHAANKGDFTMLLIRDLQRRLPATRTTAGFKRLALSEWGRQALGID